MIMQGNYSFKAEQRNLFQVQGSRCINSHHKKIWHIITQPGHLKNYHPYCKIHEKSEWNKIGDSDISYFHNGKKRMREVIEWNEGKGYTIKTINNDGISTNVQFEISEINENQSNFTLKISTDAYKNIPRPIWYLFARYFLFPSFKKYLYSILKGLEYYAETGKKVRKNQFGRHRKFSP